MARADFLWIIVFKVVTRDLVLVEAEAAHSLSRHFHTVATTQEYRTAISGERGEHTRVLTYSFRKKNEKNYECINGKIIENLKKSPKKSLKNVPFKGVNMWNTVE